MMSNSMSNVKIVMMGDKNKLLIWDMERKSFEFQSVRLNEKSDFEFNLFSSACTLPDGSILLTGGGCSDRVYKLRIIKDEDKYNIQVQEKQSMGQIRKEHVTLYF